MEGECLGALHCSKASSMLPRADTACPAICEDCDLPSDLHAKDLSYSATRLQQTRQTWQSETPT